MEVVALVSWVLTACAGLYLLLNWVAHGGLRRGDSAPRYPVALVLGHPVVAVAGLLVWVLFLFTADVVYAWAALGALAVVAGLGLLMAARWLAEHRWRLPKGDPVFPTLVVGAHGVLAIATVALTFLATVLVAFGS